jgi:hypothetical protein
MNFRLPFVTMVFDARLVTLDVLALRATFERQGREYPVVLPFPAFWALGTVGILKTSDDVGMSEFYAYPDQRLKREPENDNFVEDTWGWSIERRAFSVRAGIIPGMSGAFVRDECESLELPIPPEFSRLCREYRICPREFLQGFIADLCGIVDSPQTPREDGYCSSGLHHEVLARKYLRLVDLVFHAARDASEVPRKFL